MEQSQRAFSCFRNRDVQCLTCLIVTVISFSSGIILLTTSTSWIPGRSLGALLTFLAVVVGCYACYLFRAKCSQTTPRQPLPPKLFFEKRRGYKIEFEHHDLDVINESSEGSSVRSPSSPISPGLSGISKFRLLPSTSDLTTVAEDAAPEPPSTDSGNVVTTALATVTEAAVSMVIASKSGANPDSANLNPSSVPSKDRTFSRAGDVACSPRPPSRVVLRSGSDRRVDGGHSFAPKSTVDGSVTDSLTDKILQSMLEVAKRTSRVLTEQDVARSGRSENSSMHPPVTDEDGQVEDRRKSWPANFDSPKPNRKTF